VGEARVEILVRPARDASTKEGLLGSLAGRPERCRKSALALIFGASAVGCVHLSPSAMTGKPAMIKWIHCVGSSFD
jgi:hypothetical protein